MQKFRKNISSNTYHGFSMIELILIMVMLGIFASMALTRTNTGLAIIKEQIAIDQITSDVDLVRSMAFGKHDTITIVFSEAQESYTIFEGPNGSRTRIEDFPNSDNGTIVLDSPALRDVNLKTVDFDGGRELQFLPMGEPKHGGTIVLNNRSILIESVTGRWSIE